MDFEASQVEETHAAKNVAGATKEKKLAKVERSAYGASTRAERRAQTDGREGESQCVCVGSVVELAGEKKVESAAVAGLSSYFFISRQEGAHARFHRCS